MLDNAVAQNLPDLPANGVLVMNWGPLHTLHYLVEFDYVDSPYGHQLCVRIKVSRVSPVKDKIGFPEWNQVDGLTREMIIDAARTWGLNPLELSEFCFRTASNLVDRLFEEEFPGRPRTSKFVDPYSGDAICKY